MPRRDSVTPEIKRRFTVKKDWDIGRKGEKFDIGTLSAAERKEAQDVSEVAAALFIKGVLHRSNPRMYPVSTRASPAEVHMANIISAMDTRQFEEVSARVKKTLR